MSYGYWGKILVVNLTSGSIQVEEPPEETYRQFLGGIGLGVHFLYQRIPPGADPLGPHNVLGFFPGLLTGSGAQFAGRFMVVARSPLTGAWGEANCGGDFGPALRGAGYDGVLFLGASPHPVYLSIHPDQVELRDATELWGQDTHQTERFLRKVCAPGARVACIGPAGERLSLMAGIVNDEGRLAARCGLGAVMGSKKLKAVVTSGMQRPQQAFPSRFRQASNRYLTLFKRKPGWLAERIPRVVLGLLPTLRRFKIAISGGAEELVVDTFRRYGTSIGTAMSIELGDAPVKNWSGVGYRDFPLERAERLSGDSVIEQMLKPFACHSCPVACGGISKLPDGALVHRPEYESLVAFGALSQVDDLEAVMRCCARCNLAGLDSISVGVAAAFAIECAENGWLPTDLAHELPLAWGYAGVLVTLVERIANRQPGLGEWLADGVQRASQVLPEHARQAAMHAGSQELPMHRGPFQPGVALGYAVDPAPGRHTASMSGIATHKAFAPYFAMHGMKPAVRHDYPNMGKTMAISMAILRAYDSLGLCHFGIQMSRPPFLEWLNSATGWELSEQDFYETGWRIQVMRHAFNARHGLPAQFALPQRELADESNDGSPTGGVILDMFAMTEAYFSFLGIDCTTGLPSPSTCQKLGTEVLEPFFMEDA